MIVEFLPSLLAVFLCTVVLVDWRNQAEKKSAGRVWQLEQAAESLQLHATTMDRFLSDGEAPRVLKQFLVLTSEALSQRETALLAADWLVKRPWQVYEPPASPSEKDFFDALESLQATTPALYASFRTAVLTGTVGSLLRWPESARMFEQAGAKATTNPEVILSAAAAAMAFRPPATFGSSTAATA